MPRANHSLATHFCLHPYRPSLRLLPLLWFTPGLPRFATRSIASSVQKSFRRTHRDSLQRSTRRSCERWQARHPCPSTVMVNSAAPWLRCSSQVNPEETEFSLSLLPVGFCGCCLFLRLFASVRFWFSWGCSFTIISKAHDGAFTGTDWPVTHSMLFYAFHYGEDTFSKHMSRRERSFDTVQAMQ